MPNPNRSRTTPLAIAAPHPAALAAGHEIAERGGNAVDVAVAAAVALTVVYPHMCSVGGDAIILLRRPDGEVRCINATGAFGSGRAPGLSADASMPVYGVQTVTVPGAVSGWAALLAAGGSLDAGEVLLPAIRLAREGSAVSPGLATALREDRDALAEDTGMRDVFFRGADVLAEGELLIQPALADSLTMMAEDGFGSFYRGRLAARLAEGLAAVGASITPADLARHEASIEQALTGDVLGHRVHTAAPNSQGFTFLRNIGAFAGGGQSATDAGVLAELFYSSDAIRDMVLADPRFVLVDVDDYLSDAALQRARRDAETALGAARAPSIATPRPDGDTVGLTVVDADGTAISIIQSVFHAFGSRILEPETGLVLHNRGALFSLDPASPNRLEPCKRPAHTLVPVIIEFADGRLSAQGTMGGKAQSQIQAQLFLRAIEGSSPEEIVSAPRIVVGATEAGETNDTILVEGGNSEVVIAQLERTGMRLVRPEGLHSNAGHSMVSTRGADGQVAAGADPRSDGAAAVFGGARL